MKITILGCGNSSGVPLIGNNWGKCDPADPRNRRLRVSALVEEGNTTILIDTSPDLREQLLACNLRRLSAVFYTHAHADHTHGLDDLRSVNWMTGKPVDIYADKGVMEELKERFVYVFKPRESSSLYLKPALTPHLIEGPLTLGPIKITPFVQEHGKGTSLGFRFNDFAYSTDVSRLDDTAFEALRGIKVWVVDCMREEPHTTHGSLDLTLEWIAKVKPERAYLTHMDQSLDYKTLAAKLPPGVLPAHDGLVIEC